ncbi:MAG: prolipoprotein diacylglyceryl transferase family protein [Ferruginibacter sp.]|nr:diacylglyceryl transferase [Ferruginibacter sp.]
MYPNLYYIFKDLFGVQWNFLKIFNSFGLMVAVAFFVAILILGLELKRREKLGLLHPSDEIIEIGKPASIFDFILNGLTGFIFGSKIFGLIFSKPETMNTQDYIFSKEGNILGGIAIAALLIGLKWYEKNKQKLKTPEKRTIRIWPHDRVGDIFVIALIFGILGAKLFDNFEHWNEFIQDPIGKIFSQSGLTFYGGLILASFAVCFYAYKKGIKIPHLVDSAAASLMIAYAIGRIGCQVSGDGDWGVYNSAYTSDAYGNISLAAPGDFEKALQKNASYFLEGIVTDSTGKKMYVTDRIYPTLKDVPHQNIKGFSFLPKWFFAYSFPQNVNNDGVPIPGVKEDHYNVLPSPVFPTAFYETVICILLFLFLWAIRKKIKTPFVMFGIYLILNGFERFIIELLRVNKTYAVSGFTLSQAQEIALMLIVAGIITITFGKIKYKKEFSNI